jgi:hypothetical protein
MVDHVKLTMAILFINIIISVLFPAQVLGDSMQEYLYSGGDDGSFQVSNKLLQSFGATVNAEGGIAQTDVNLIVVFKLIYEFIKLLFTIALASPIIILYLSGIWQLLIGVPLVIMYLFAIVGWVYR